MHSAELSVFRAIIVLAIIMVLQPVAIAKVHDADLWAAFKFGIKNTLNSMAAGANNMAGVALATASAGIIVGCVSLGLGQQITSFVEALSMGNIFLMILITAVASLLLGMGLPTTANYIIMASLTAPRRTRFPSASRASSTIFVQPSSRYSSSSIPTFF